MFEDLLPYYSRELTFFRRTAEDFARNNPKIAARLKLGPESSEDPHVERLIEAFALLNARTRQKLEDDFPELTQAFFSVLYPNYLRPVPSAAILQLNLDKSQADRTDGAPVARGTTVETDTIAGESCRFRTCYETVLWPFRVSAAGFFGKPFTAPVTPFSTASTAVIQIDLECFGKKLAFNDLSLDAARFFMKGQSNYVHPLYELLFDNVLGVAVAAKADGEPLAVWGADRISPVGFEPEEALYPWPANVSDSFRLLTEFFAFPAKFHFFDLKLGPLAELPERTSKLSVFIYLDKHLPDLEQTVDQETFQTGCTPIVNLYRQRAEPFQLTNREFEYRVLPSATNPLGHEVFSVDRVSLASDAEEDIPVHEFFSLSHSQTSREQYFWQSSRRTATNETGDVDRGTEVYLSLVDLSGDQFSGRRYSVDIETTCLNRDLPGRLPFGGGQPRMTVREIQIPLESTKCLTPPTPTLRPPTAGQSLWRLISHLTLGHLSLADGADGAAALRETLALYDYRDSPETRDLIESLQEVNSAQIVGRLPDDTHAVVRGTEITLQFDRENFSEKGLYLMSLVLERFFANHCTINSFIRLKVKLEGREEVIETGPGRSGERILI